MKRLLEDYKKRLKTLNEELTITINDGVDLTQISILTVKRSCYRTFISELERIVPAEKPISLKDEAKIKEQEKKEYDEWVIENNKRNEEWMKKLDEKEKQDLPPEEFR